MKEYWILEQEFWFLGCLFLLCFQATQILIKILKLMPGLIILYLRRTIKGIILIVDIDVPKIFHDFLCKNLSFPLFLFCDLNFLILDVLFDFGDHALYVLITKKADSSGWFFGNPFTAYKILVWRLHVDYFNW